MKNKISGIYAIFRKCDDKCMYIGQSIDCERRILAHMRGNTHTPIENKDYYYTDIIEKHGFDSTEFRLSREAFWINIFEPEWNKMCDRTHCEESRQKISKNNGAHRPEVRQKIREANLGENNPMYGKPRSEEVRQKISESLIGTKRSEETRQKIREAIKGKHWKLVDGKRVYY